MGADNDAMVSALDAACDRDDAPELVSGDGVMVGDNGYGLGGVMVVPY